MAGYVIGSKAHYESLKEKLIDISTILQSFELNEDEKKELFAKQVQFMNHMEKYFPNGHPK